MAIKLAQFALVAINKLSNGIQQGHVPASAGNVPAAGNVLPPGSPPLMNRVMVAS